jgi:L-ascorbate metabolism protein UlaG (beta-lactamase superfamily)
MIIQYHGHSCMQISTAQHSIILDPFITPNPASPTKADSIEVQYVLLSHAHMDHISDAAEIAKRNDATIIATAELATYFSWQGANVHGMNIGGSHLFDFGKVKLTQAFHSSGIIQEDKQLIHYMGMPAGFIITIGGKTIYYAGDTSLFYDMKHIGETVQVDLAFLPIGDNFTMGPEDALLAAEWLKAGLVIPMHYNTFPVIEQDADKFVMDLQEKGLKGKVLKPGESFEF